MAKQVGLVRYQGTMGGVRHFKIKGLSGDFAGLKGGTTKEQILSTEEFKRTRENMSEFGGSATAGKVVRKSLAALVKSMRESRLTSRLTSVLKRMNLEANGKRGQFSVGIFRYKKCDKNKLRRADSEGIKRETATADGWIFMPDGWCDRGI